MYPSLRLLARSRGLRALGLLAWLMLVLSSLAAAAPFGVAHVHAAPGSGAGAMAAEPAHQAMAHMLSQDDSTHAHDHCCGGDFGHACGCVGLCASVLPPMSGGVTALPATLAYAPPLRVRAPSTPRVPPLRPPLA